MDRVTHKTLNKELKEVTRLVIISNKNDYEVRLFTKETTKKYKKLYKQLNNLMDSRSLELAEIKRLPKRLPNLPRNFESIMVVTSVVTPIIFCYVFYSFQAELFFSSLFGVISAPIILLIFFRVNGITLRKQFELINNLLAIILFLKNQPK